MITGVGSGAGECNYITPTRLQCQNTAGMLPKQKMKKKLNKEKIKENKTKKRGPMVGWYGGGGGGRCQPTTISGLKSIKELKISCVYQ